MQSSGSVVYICETVCTFTITMRWYFATLMYVSQMSMYYVCYHYSLFPRSFLCINFFSVRMNVVFQ